MSHRPSGLKPTPRHRLAAATPHVAQPAPAQYLVLPSKLSMWHNSDEGDCVTAGEAAAKATTGIFITDATVQTWAAAHGDLNGADIETVLTQFQTGGFSQDGNVYNDGPHTSVDWTNPPTLQSAISQGPVKIGVASSQLQGVQGIGVANGWFAVGFKADPNFDHDTELFGYGTIAWLAECFGVAVPAGVDGTKPGYALFTWGTVGIIDAPSLEAIVGEAWLRTPTTIVVGTAPPTSEPVAKFPAQPPAPIPGPVPSTTSVTVDEAIAWATMGLRNHWPR